MALQKVRPYKRSAVPSRRRPPGNPLQTAGAFLLSELPTPSSTHGYGKDPGKDLARWARC